MVNANKFNFICPSDNFDNLGIDFFLSECFITVVLKTCLPVLIILLSIGFLTLKNIFKIYIFSTSQYTQLEQNANLVSVDIDESEELNNLKPTPA
ncbi:hypothetical protein CONCODRAFT_13149, partial [Conidiobolus coronatus NRRL 28638]